MPRDKTRGEIDLSLSIEGIKSGQHPEPLPLLHQRLGGKEVAGLIGSPRPDFGLEVPPTLLAIAASASRPSGEGDRRRLRRARRRCCRRPHHAGGGSVPFSQRPLRVDKTVCLKNAPVRFT
jgi:hypothetical protein